MNSIFEMICRLSDNSFVSGKEGFDWIPDTSYEADDVGNVWLLKKGTANDAKNIVIEAHRDEIGLCISKIHENGFLSVVPCGGIDVSILPSTEFTVCGSVPFRAIATSIPPHLKNVGEKNEKLTVEQIYLDGGFSSYEEAKKFVSVGDVAVFAPMPAKMSNDRIVSRSLDNKAAVAALLQAFDKVQSTENNVYFLFSVGEETTSRGVRNFCRQIKPDLAIVVDAGFGYTEGMERSSSILMDGGPSVSYTDTLSLAATEWVVDTAKKHGIPLQKIAEPGGTGTSATAMQTENGGIPSVVISIPVMNMHTPGEIVSESDIQNTVELLFRLATSEEIPQREVKIV